MVAVVPGSSRYQSLAEVLAADKQKPGSVSVASSGVGSSTHLTLEMVNAMTGSRLVHVPYKGGGQAVTDLVGGQIDMMFSGFNATLMQLIQAGKVRPIAVSTAQRLQVLPKVSTFTESGLSGVDLVSAQSVFAPATVSAERLGQLNADFNEVLQSADIREKWAQAGLLPFQPQTLAQVDAWFTQESKRWGALIREKHITAE
jgi:tripartite-type tricarboxylate transporter receptor subunit TctC